MFNLEVDTELGTWSFAGDQEGLRRLQLAPAAPARSETLPAWAESLAELLQAHARGEAVDYGDVPLAGDPGGFEGRVRQALRTVRFGETLSYGELARRAGRPGAARAVGGAMARNTVPLVVPCHRVLPSSRGVGGFSAPGGAGTKLVLLAREGVHPRIPSEPCPFDSLARPGAMEVAAGELSRRDPVMARVLEQVQLWSPSAQASWPPFAALARIVVYQQLAGRAAASIFARLQGALGCSDDRFPGPRELLEVPLQTLREAGLSAAKAATIRALAKALVDEESELSETFLLEAPYAKARAALLEVKGLGPWSVQMFGMFHRFEPDLFPCTDLGVQKAISRHYLKGRAASPERVERLGRRWRPFRSLVAWLLWRTDGVVTL